jgi:PIN domain nuclease of toxin-antitoxin system
MRLLLDTHTLFWALTDPPRLGHDARAAISDAANSVAASAANAWEMGTKRRIGKMPEAEAIVTDFAAHLARLRADILPIDADHALLAGSLDWDHRDPFDRVLAAQAMLTNRTLVTKDPAFLTLPGLRTLW